MLVLLALLGCNPEKKENLEKLEALQDAMQGYESWDQHADWTGIQESLDGTHGSHVQIWMDDEFLATVNAQAGDPMPAGAMAVKEGYFDEDGTDLNEVVAHQRQDDGTLFYASFDPDGEVKQYGRPELCTDCHVLGQDEVMSLEW